MDRLDFVGSLLETLQLLNIGLCIGPKLLHFSLVFTFGSHPKVKNMFRMDNVYTSFIKSNLFPSFFVEQSLFDLYERKSTILAVIMSGVS